MEKKNNFMLVVIVVLSILLLGAVSFIVYDKVIKKDDTANTTTKPINNNEQSNDSSATIDKTNNDNVDSNQNKQANTTTYEKNNFEIVKDNNDTYVLKVNDKITNFKFACEECSEVKQLSDILIVSSCGSGCLVYAVDKNGEMVAAFDNKYYDIYGNINPIPVKGSIDGTRVEGNDLYIESQYVCVGGCSSEDMCQVINYHKNQAPEMSYVAFEEKFTYLGNGKFSSPIVTKKVSAQEFEKQFNIDCSKY